MTTTQQRPLEGQDLEFMDELFDLCEAYASLGDAVAEQCRDTTKAEDYLTEDDEDYGQRMTAGAAGYVEDRLVGRLYGLVDDLLREWDPEDMREQVAEFAARVREARTTRRTA
jgi:hypothetical protein